MTDSSKARKPRRRSRDSDVLAAVGRLVVATFDDLTVRAVAVISACALILFAADRLISFHSDFLDWLLGVAATIAILRVIFVNVWDTVLYVRDEWAKRR